MDILDLQASLKHVAYHGVALNIDERVQLELGLEKLANQESCDELLFWGKVIGTAKDYYLALAVDYQGKYEFPQKTFYWCSSSNFTFSEMPELNEQHADAVDKMNACFSGEHDKVLISVEKKEEGGEEAK